MKMQKQLWMLSGLSVAVIAAVLVLPPISQPAEYHQFADQKSFLNIPNFNDVASNLAFLLSGGSGLVYLLWIYQASEQKAFLNKIECLPYWIFFLSVIATGLGSGFYHWAPDNTTLLWDRLPIAMSITALLAATLIERVSPTLGVRSLPVLITMGVLSVLYWHWTEQQGAGNLNFYVVTQFYSIFLIILLSLYSPSRYTHEKDIYQVIALYAVAKLTELLDVQIYSLTAQLISGHTLKHLLAALAVYRIVQMLQKRAFH
jgi:hypothetical protein